MLIIDVLAALVATFPALIEAKPLHPTEQSVVKAQTEPLARDNQTYSSQDDLYHATGFIHAIISHAEKHEFFTIKVQFGGQNVDLLIDTGSTATWIGTGETLCRGVPTNPSDFCRFKDPAFTLAHFDPEHDSFLVSYANGEKIIGDQGKVDIQALFSDGAKSFNTIIGKATEAKYNGRGVDQGVMGLAPDPQGTDSDQLPPILKSYAAQRNEREIFTLALSDSSAKWSVILFGNGLEFDYEKMGVHINKANKAENVPCWIEDSSLKPKGTRRHVKSGDHPHDWAIEAKTFHVTPQSKAGSLITRDVIGKTVVDSGTDQLVLHRDIVKLIYSSYTPAVTGGEDSPVVPCTSVPPQVEVNIGEKWFPISPTSLKKTWPDGTCQSMLEAMVTGENSMILGTPFLKDVVAAHDAAAKKMGFYQRTG